MKEHGIPEEGTPETTNPPDFTCPPRETFCPLHHTKMNTVTLSRPSWASTVYEQSFDEKEPTTNQFTPKRFNRSYANVTKTHTPTATYPYKSKQNPQSTQKRKNTNTTTTRSIPKTTTTSPSSKPSTLTPPSEQVQQPTVVSPTSAAISQKATAPVPSAFERNTEQCFLKLVRN